VVAADIKNLQEVIFNKGDLAKAVRASISIPGIFMSVPNKNKILVDGGILDNLPIKALASKNPDCIIAINLEGKKILQEVYEEAVPENDISKIPNIIETLLRTYDIISLVLLKNNLQNYKNTLILSPNLKGIKTQSFNKIDEGINIGYAFAKINSKKINSLIKKDSFLKRIKKILVPFEPKSKII